MTHVFYFISHNPKIKAFASFSPKSGTVQTGITGTVETGMVVQFKPKSLVQLKSEWWYSWNRNIQLNERDFNFWKMNITTSHHSLNTADSIIRNLKSNLKIDSLIEVQLRNIIDQSNQRVEVYKKSYEDAIVLAEGYSKQLGNCIELHKIKPRPRKWEAAVWGGVGGVIIGLLTGVAISR